jgi:hypothetical protein
MTPRALALALPLRLVPAIALALLASAAAVPLLGCSEDLVCFDCQDARIEMQELSHFQGLTAHVRGVASDSRSAATTVVIDGAHADVVFERFIRNGDGPYRVLAWIDMDSDGQCRDAVDRAWQETFDDSSVWVIDASDPRTVCALTTP